MDDLRDKYLKAIADVADEAGVMKTLDTYAGYLA